MERRKFPRVHAGVPSLDLSVVVGSGTGDLVGLTGRGTIEHTEAGAHLDPDYDV